MLDTPRNICSLTPDQYPPETRPRGITECITRRVRYSLLCHKMDGPQSVESKVHPNVYISAQIGDYVVRTYASVHELWDWFDLE